MNGRPSRPPAQIALALGVVGLAFVIGYQTTTIPVSPIYARIGPTVFPALVAVALLALGAALFYQAWHKGWNTPEEDQGPVDRRAVAWVLLGLLLNVALIKPLGFILASTLLFACVARGFGSARPLRDGAIGFVFAGAVYIGFDRVLGISIGAGPLEGLL